MAEQHPEGADVADKLTQAGVRGRRRFLLDLADDILAFSAFRPEHWTKIRSNNPSGTLG